MTKIAPHSNPRRAEQLRAQYTLTLYAVEWSRAHQMLQGYEISQTPAVTLHASREAAQQFVNCVYTVMLRGQSGITASWNIDNISFLRSNGTMMVYPQGCSSWYNKNYFIKEITVPRGSATGKAWNKTVEIFPGYLQVELPKRREVLKHQTIEDDIQQHLQGAILHKATCEILSDEAMAFAAAPKAAGKRGVPRC